MTKSKSKQPEDQRENHELPESSETPKVPTKASEWRLPSGCVEVEGESHIFVGGFPCAPPKKSKWKSRPIATSSA
jgi:hypothetical protein